MTTHKGSCHCGKIQFEVVAAAKLEATRCNCSICSMCGFLHLFVSRDNFRLLQGSDSLTTYTFNTGVAKHTFCSHCGIKSFYVPRSHPDAVSINVNCLDPATIEGIEETAFDGRNWEQKVGELSQISD